MCRVPFRQSVAILTAATLLLAASPAWPQDTTDRATLVALADYQEKLAQYERAHGAYEREHEAYWHAVAEKRKLRNAKRRKHEAMQLTDYVLTQPPIYSGPPRPVSPLPPPPPPSVAAQAGNPGGRRFLKRGQRAMGLCAGPAG